MYTLRSINDYGLVRNQIVGSFYERVLPEAKNNFQLHLEHIWPNKKDQEKNRSKVHSFLIFGTVTPLYYDHEYYIMTSDGGTFENLTIHKG